MKKVNIVEVRFTHGASAQFHADAWHYDTHSENWELTEGGKPVAGIPRSHVLYVTNLGEVDAFDWWETPEATAAYWATLTDEQRHALAEAVTEWYSALKPADAVREPGLPIPDVRETFVPSAKFGDSDDGGERLT